MICMVFCGYLFSRALLPRSCLFILFIDIVLTRYSEKLLITTNQNRLPPPFT